MEAPKNAPPKEHLAALFVGFLLALPDHLSEKSWTVEKFPFSGFVGVSFGLLIDSKGTKFLTRTEAVNLDDFRYCEPIYYPELGNCFSHNPVISTTWFAQQDRNYMDTMIHEYGHNIGSRIRVIGDDGTTDNVDRQFAKISFEIKDGAPLTMLRPDANHGEFISGYAKTNGYEDFADSFSAYVVGGKIFRERVKGTVYLQRKYDFLRDKVFAGYEYDTGDLDNFKTLIKQYPENIGNHPSIFYNSDYVWDYNYQILSTKHTDIPSSTTPSTPVTNTAISSKVDYDLNNDGKINCKDTIIFIGQYGQKGTNLSADLNNDGIVDGIDYNMLVRNYTPGDTTVCSQ